MAQIVKNLPAIQGIWVRFLGLEDPLKEGVATHSSILAWTIPMDREEPGGLQSMGGKESDTTKQLTLHTFTITFDGTSLLFHVHF